MPTQNAIPSKPTTFAITFGTDGLAGSVRALTKTLLGPWDELPVGRRMPATPSTAKLKADIRDQKVKPFEHLLRMLYASVDAGIPVEKVTQCLRDCIALVDQYAARKARREGAGLLPFPQRFLRICDKRIAEQGDAESAGLRVIRESATVADLEKARKERLEVIAVDEAEVEALTTEIAYRRSRGEG
jgi:hypothetical protein